MGVQKSSSVIIGDDNIGEENRPDIRDPPYQKWGMQGDGRGGSGGAVGACIAVVLASSVGYWDGPDLAPALPFALFRPPASSPGCSPSTASMPYLPSYSFNVLVPSLDLSSSVIVALFVFIPVSVAECSFPFRACRRHLMSDSPLGPWSDLCTKLPCMSDWPVSIQGMLDGVIGGDSAGFVVMAGEASPSPLS
ncbi:hypothetical protein EDD85DRAFT_963221 [Armillaria nabsnona]|nr:hypothetical protein EDD85DRAFT_963221 [Armillaria nabsnona]